VGDESRLLTFGDISGLVAFELSRSGMALFWVRSSDRCEDNIEGGGAFDPPSNGACVEYIDNADILCNDGRRLVLRMKQKLRLPKMLC
jgi:hypothetical protein